VYLLVALVAGVLQMTSPSLRALLWPTYVHLFVLGWLTQLIFGVAWMFPRRSAKEPHGSELLGLDQLRGSEPLAWLSLTLLNVGILTVGLGQTLNAPTSVSLLGRVAEALAACAFAMQAWPRARAYTAPGSSASRVFQAMVLLQIVRHSPSGPSHSGHCIARKRLQSAIWTGAGRSWPAPASATK
jgi:hypothetical protein